MPDQPIIQPDPAAAQVGGQQSGGLGAGQDEQPAEGQQAPSETFIEDKDFDPEKLAPELKPVYDGMRSSFHKKMNELDLETKGYTKPFSQLTSEEQQSRFNDLLQNPTFQGLANQRMQQYGYTQQNQKLEGQDADFQQIAQQWDRYPEADKQNYWAGLDETSKQAMTAHIKLAKQDQQIQFLAKNQLESNRSVEETTMAAKYGDNFKKAMPQLRQMQNEQAQAGKAFSLEECYKINNFDKQGEKAVEDFKTEQQGDLTHKQEASQLGTMGIPGTQAQQGTPKDINEAVEQAEKQHGTRLPG